MYTRLTKEERNQLVLENLGLVKYWANRLMQERVLSAGEFDDLVSIGILGLIEATEKSRNSEFKRYAGVCIKNAIRMYLRKERRHLNISSLDDYIEGDGQTRLGDTIPEKSEDMIEVLITEEAISTIVNIIFNVFKPKERVSILYTMGGLKQQRIGEILNCTQSCVSKNMTKMRSELRKYLAMRRQNKGAFSMTVQDNSYRISFSIEDEGNFNEFVVTFLQNFATDSILLDFKIEYDKKKVVIQVPAILESFIIIAQILQVTDGV